MRSGEYMLKLFFIKVYFFMRPQRGFSFRAFRFSCITSFLGERWERIESAGLLGSSPRRGVYVCVCLILVIFYGFLFCLFLWIFFMGFLFCLKKKKNEHTLTPVLRVKFGKGNVSAGEESWLLVMKFFNIHTYVHLLFIYLLFI